MPRVTAKVSTQQSAVWQTNTGIIDTPDGVILVDPGILASDFDALVASLGDRKVAAGFSTHFHWDHILWVPELGAVPRFASGETVRLMSAERARIVRTLDAFEQQLAAEQGLGPQWDRSLFFDVSHMPLGPGEIAGVACELVDVSGHADGQVALVLPDDDVAFVADTLSDIETPSISEGIDRFERYLATLDRLRDVIDRVSWIIPGHGEVADRSEAQRRLDADRRYLQLLPDLVAAASEDVSDEDLARSTAASLGEERTAPGLSWDMHLANIRLLRAGTAA